MCEIFSKFTRKTLERRSGASIVDFEQINDGWEILKYGFLNLELKP